MSDILVFSPPIDVSISGVPTNLVEICGWLDQEGYDFDQVCLSTLTKSKNKGRLTKDYVDLSLLSNENLLEYLEDGEQNDIPEIANRLGDLMDIDSYDIIIVVAPTEFIASHRDFYLMRSLPILKERAEDKITIIGNLESKGSKNCVQLPYVDYVIRGDMEIPLNKILDHELENEKLDDVSGLCYTESGEIVDNGKYKHPVNMKATPYFESELIGQLKDYFAFKYPIIPYQLGKGCSQDCSFCSLFEDQTFNYKDIDKVVNDIQKIKEKTGSSRIWFTDENLFNDPDYILGLAERLIEENIDIKWAGMSIIVPREQKFFDKLSKSGCVALQHGIESVSDSVLHRMRKSQTKSMIEDVIEKESNSGIKPYGLFLTDYVNETWDEYNETIDFIRNNDDLRGGRVVSLSVYATERQPIYDNPKEHGVSIESKESKNWMREALDQSVKYSDARDLDEEERGKIRKIKEEHFGRKIGYELFLKNYMRRNPLKGLQFQIKCLVGDYKNDISHYYV